MNVIDVAFSEDIVLDEEAFDKAIEDFSALSDKLQRLRLEVEDMISAVCVGFDTPAGAKFIKSCEKNLFQPLDAQKVVLEHISSTLRESKQAYETVFREYEELQSTINKANN